MIPKLGYWAVQGVSTLCTLGMLEKYIKCLDFIALHNISSMLPLKCIPTEKNRKNCCALICGHYTDSYINRFPALSLNLKFEFGGF